MITPTRVHRDRDGPLDDEGGALSHVCVPPSCREEFRPYWAPTPTGALLAG